MFINLKILIKKWRQSFSKKNHMIGFDSRLWGNPEYP